MILIIDTDALASITGYSILFLDKIAPPPPGVGHIDPFEVWTKKTSYYDKYFKIVSGESLQIRIVSGFLPYLAHWTPSKGYKICPSTLRFQSNGRYIYRKDDGTFYTEEESKCPLCQIKQKHALRYMFNAIDVEEYERLGTNCKIKILQTNMSTFTSLHNVTETFKINMHDLDEGFTYFLLKQAAYRGFMDVRIGKKYPLDEKMKEVCSHVRTDREPFGVWPLIPECHPFKCSDLIAIDNGHNPLFRK